jgi:hypothetical protein
MVEEQQQRQDDDGVFQRSYSKLSPMFFAEEDFQASEDSPTCVYCQGYPDIGAGQEFV